MIFIFHKFHFSVRTGQGLDIKKVMFSFLGSLRFSGF